MILVRVEVGKSIKSAVVHNDKANVKYLLHFLRYLLYLKDDVFHYYGDVFLLTYN